MEIVIFSKCKKYLKKDLTVKQGAFTSENGKEETLYISLDMTQIA